MNSTAVYICAALLAAINLVGILLVGIDKYKAKKHAWRIAERTFFIFALFGASLGVYLGCLLIRHKTRHLSFMLGLPAILFLQGIGIYVIWMNF